eukprot:Ihof_evm3s642 gene=Ihof_evmTU3s642
MSVSQDQIVSCGNKDGCPSFGNWKLEVEFLLTEQGFLEVLSYNPNKVERASTPTKQEVFVRGIIGRCINTNIKREIGFSGNLFAYDVWQALKNKYAAQTYLNL